MTTITTTQRFVARELDFDTVGRRFYVYDTHAGRSVGRMWGARHLAEREAARRNALYVASQGGAR